MGVFGFILTLGTSVSKGSSSSSCTRFPHLVRYHHQFVLHLDSEFSLDLRAHCSAILVFRLLSIVHIVGLCGFHFSVHVEIENVVCELDRNEFALSTPVHQFLKKNSHSLTSFAANGNHLCTVMSSVSSIQRSKPSVFIVSLKLPSSTSWNPFSTGCPIESFHLLLLSDQSSMGICSLQLLCPGSSSPIHIASDYIWHQDEKFQVKMGLRKCHTFVHNLRAIQQNSSHRKSSHRSIRQRSNHRSKKCHWCMSGQIPECPSLPPISRPERPAFEILPLCKHLAPWFAHLVPLDFPLDFPLFSLL